MGDSILSHQAVDVYSDLKISPSQYILRKKSGLSKNRVDKDGISKLYTSPQHTNLKVRNFAEENVFNVLANQSMLQTEVWKTQMALNDELIAAQVLEREERQKRAIKYQKLLEEVEKLSQSNHQKEDKIYQLIVQNTNLKKNICSLYKTAKSEVEQKNSLLLDANEERDRLKRRLSKKNTFLQSERESLIAKPLEISRTEKEKSCPSDVDRKRKNSEDCKVSNRKRRYYDSKGGGRKDLKSKTSGNSSIRCQKNERKYRDTCTKKSSFSKYQNSESKVFYSKRHETSKIKQKDNIKNEPSKNLLDSKAIKKVNVVKKVQGRDYYKSKNVELDETTEKKLLKYCSSTSVSNKNKKFKDNVASTSCCSDNTPKPAESNNLSDNCNNISAVADQNIITEEYNQVAESNSAFAEQKIGKKQKPLQTLPVIPNLLTQLPIYRKCFDDDEALREVKSTEHNDVQCEDLSYLLSKNDDNKNKPDLPDNEKCHSNFLNDKTTTNALFFGLLPNEIRETFLEYEQRLITMINNLKQTFVNYCLNSTKKTLLYVLPEILNQIFIGYEQKLIIITNGLKQTFVNSCLTHAENEAREISVPSSNKVQPNFEKQYKTNKIQADDNNKVVSDLPPLFLEQKECKITQNLDSSHELNEVPLLIETAVIGVKSVNDVSENELEIECEKNESTIEQIIKSQEKPNKISKCVENSLTFSSNGNGHFCSQDDDKNSDSTQKVPSYYREIFLSNEKNACNFVNKTSSINSALVNHSRDNESVSSKSVTFNSTTSHSDQSDSDTTNIKPHSSVPFHPSLSSVYYRRQLLKAAIEEKAEKGLSKLTKENINNLYRYRRTKISSVGHKKE